MSLGRHWLVRTAVVLSVILVACGDDDDEAADEQTTTTAESTTTTLDEAAAEAEITAAFETFFDGSIEAADAKYAVLERGDEGDVRTFFATNANNPEFADARKNTRAQVDEVTFGTDTEADVSFFLVTPTGDKLLPNAITGSAVSVEGAWKVSVTTLCDVAALGNTALAEDPVCAVE